ncbi:MAG: ABC transporter permease [Thermoplasmata archaeon]|nr:ABC transporter permease [Thermoplasmata archaeon]
MVTRSVRNLFRNKSRTAVVTLIVGFALAIFLSASMISSNISTSVVELSESMETTIVVQPAGTSSFSMFGGSTTLMNESVLDSVWSVTHVESANPILTQMETDDSTTDFRMGTTVQGMDPGEGIFLTMGSGTIEVTDGRSLDSGDELSYVAEVGSEYANRTGVGVGDTITLNESDLTVVGIFTSGTMFGGSTVIIPYEIAKAVYDLDGMQTVYVTADAVGNMDEVIDDIQAVLGDDYDVAALSAITSEGADTMQASMDSMVASSEFGAMASLLAAGAVMTFVMVLVTRERTREIGILKALGFKNSKIASQLLTESISLSMIGFGVGLVITLVGAPYLISMFGGTTATMDFPSPGDLPDASTSTDGFAPSARTSGTAIDLELSWDLIAYGLLLAVGLGVLGALYPILTSLRLRPAEALRQ